MSHPVPYLDEESEKFRILQIKKEVVRLENQEVTFIQFVNIVKSFIRQPDLNLEEGMQSFDLHSLYQLED